MTTKALYIEITREGTVHQALYVTAATKNVGEYVVARTISEGAPRRRWRIRAVDSEAGTSSIGELRAVFSGTYPEPNGVSAILQKDISDWLSGRWSVVGEPIELTLSEVETQYTDQVLDLITNYTFHQNLRAARAAAGYPEIDFSTEGLTVKPTSPSL